MRGIIPPPLPQRGRGGGQGGGEGRQHPTLTERHSRRILSNNGDDGDEYLSPAFQRAWDGGSQVEAAIAKITPELAGELPGRMTCIVAAPGTPTVIGAERCLTLTECDDP